MHVCHPRGKIEVLTKGGSPASVPPVERGRAGQNALQVGLGGQPGTARSTGITFETRPQVA